jgi:hypothetical protein
MRLFHFFAAAAQDIWSAFQYVIVNDETDLLFSQNGS